MTETHATEEPAASDHLERIWAQAYAADSREDLLRLYEDWAETYDADHETIGFFGHRTAAATLARYTPFREVSNVLDAGAGTGAAGEALAALGYRDITAVDLSSAMLDKARDKGVYQRVLQADLGQPLDPFPCNHFDAAILVGVFSFGQAPAHALDEVLRLVKPGGVIAFTLRVDFYEQDAMGVRSRMEELDRGHAWKQLEVTEPEPYLPHKDPDALFRVWAYRVLETKTPPVDEDFAAAVHQAFLAEGPVKVIDHSHIWNTTASRLYDLYTECPEYYLTDSEVEILRDNAAEILDDEQLLVELGCGSALKVSQLLQAAVNAGPDRALTYTPVDVSEGALESTCAEVGESFGERFEIAPRCGRFDEMLASVPVDEPKLIVFFGGSLGNLEDVPTTVEFLHSIRERMTPDDRFVVGIDLDKDEDVLRAAYEAGPRNRSFFLNMVRRMNRELGGNLDLSAFSQRSPYEPEPSYEGIEPRCVQLRLVSERPQDAYLQNLHMELHLDAGDAVQVGTSRKYRVQDIARLAELAGLRLTRQWFDARRWFSLNEMVRDERPA